MKSTGVLAPALSLDVNMNWQQCLLLAMIVSAFSGCAPATDLSPKIVDTQPNPLDVKKATLAHMFKKFAPSKDIASEVGFKCFILADSDDSEHLVATFSNFILPVLGPERLTYKNECPFDSQTGEPAMLWSNIKVKSLDNLQASVYVEWWLGPDGAAGYSVRLAKHGNEWIVDSVNEEWMS